MPETDHYALANALATWRRLLRERGHTIKLQTTRAHAIVAWRGHTIEKWLAAMGEI